MVHVNFAWKWRDEFLKALQFFHKGKLDVNSCEREDAQSYMLGYSTPRIAP